VGDEIGQVIARAEQTVIDLRQLHQKA